MSLVLANREVLVGRISLERNYDLVLYQRNNSRMVYPAHQLLRVFYDKADNINRRYISLKENDGTHSHNYLYEVVVAGEVNVLRKVKPGAFSTHDGPLDYNYFIYYSNVMTPMGKFKRKIYPLLESRSGSHREILCRSTGLRPDLPKNAIEIIEYYNRMARTTTHCQVLARIHFCAILCVLSESKALSRRSKDFPQSKSHTLQRKRTPASSSWSIQTP